jgi:hypothetical protein
MNQWRPPCQATEPCAGPAYMCRSSFASASVGVRRNVRSCSPVVTQLVTQLLQPGDCKNIGCGAEEVVPAVS